LQPFPLSFVPPQPPDILLTPSEVFLAVPFFLPSMAKLFPSRLFPLSFFFSLSPLPVISPPFFLRRALFGTANQVTWLFFNRGFLVFPWSQTAFQGPRFFPEAPSGPPPLAFAYWISLPRRSFSGALTTPASWAFRLPSPQHFFRTPSSNFWWAPAFWCQTEETDLYGNQACSSLTPGRWVFLAPSPPDAGGCPVRCCPHKAHRLVCVALLRPILPPCVYLVAPQSHLLP